MGIARLGRTHDASLLVLTSLTGGPKHGYGLIQDIREMADVSLGPGTLYGVLARLEEEGLIQSLAPSGRRRPYCITAKGSAVLRERLQVAAVMARVGLRRLGAT